MKENHEKEKSNLKYSQKHYQVNQEVIKEKRKERYLENRENELASRRKRYAKAKAEKLKKDGQTLRSYYDASSIRVLMNLKEYTELSASKRKL